MRVEARSVTEQRNILEQSERDAKSEAESALKAANALRMKLSQTESRSQQLQTNLQTSIDQKESIEHTLQQLQEQLLAVRGKESQFTTVTPGHQLESGHAHQLIEDTVGQYQENHKREVEGLRAEIIAMEMQITQLQE